MFKDVKSSREISDEIENLSTCPSGHRPPNQPSSGLSRDPLHSIPDPTQALKPTVEKEVGFKARVETTPTKPKGKAADALPHFRTPEKQGNGTFPKNRFGWSATEPRNEMTNYLGQSSRNGGSLNITPRTTRPTTVGRPSSHTETTPTKSVSKPPNGGFAPISSSRVPASYSRNGNYAALSRGLPVCNGLPMVVNTVEVPHFDLKEDPSFWIHHNVQVIIRVRPLNSAERGVQGYNRCVKQESSQNITWIGQPESRFTFDHVACETVDQEMLFRKAGLPMVENCLSGYNSCMFAYGQTGSGKTYTMLGDIDDLEFKPSLHRGMTPRIFEYLFARIRAEEESRRDDQLKYSCKCSFLEIYNEQITDLLNPSSTNLLLREDMRKGIYVENLSEFEVYSVGDILNLLVQGSLNRKVAATNMNMESSRSHSVFTCVIESKWERDSTTNLRFARLNLVDLAGSERQKTSGAEGERLKEAANINKSLSTLGHVIMVLVDVANGKIRHVPYRDSKLTFLLQESLGGNSKTIIIANISPSTGCASETLNTLKFAQRAKLIQNNAIVNEDSSGDVSALQHQIRLLKEELSALKRQPVSRSLSFGPLSLQYNTEDHEDVDMEIDQPLSDDSVQFEAEAMKMSSQQLQSLEKIVAGALRREQMAETFIKKLEAEIEHLNRLVHQREEDARCSKMKLKFREDKIRRMDSLLKGVQPVDSYLLEENASLSEEMQLLQEKVDRNPEVTRFALENIRLLEQVKRYQDFYEEGEREIILSEVSELRDKLIQHFHENNKQSLRSNIPIAAKDPTVPEEKEICEDLLKPAEEFLNLELELDIMKIILKEERSSRAKADELGTCLSRELKLAEESIMSIRKQYEDVNEQLKEAKSTIGALKSQQLLSTNELEDLKHKNRQYVELLHKQELELVAFKQQTCHGESNDCLVFKGGKRDETLFQRRIENMQASLEKAKMLNVSYQRDHVFQKANEEEMDVIRQQVEEETAQVILSLQEELSALQQQVQDSCWKEKEVESRLVLLETTLSQQQEAFNALTCENEALREQMKEKEKDVELISKEWELLSSEIEGALTDGHEALIDASEQLDSICSYVPKKGRWISEQVHKLIKQASEKESVIEDLNACLENANARLSDMECMLRSLRGAAMVITESHQKECSEKEKEIHRLRSELSAKSTANLEMESKNSIAYDEMRKASKCATVAFIIMSRLSEISSGDLDSLKHIELQLKESIESNQMKDGLLDKCAAASEDAERQIESLRKALESAEECCHRLGAELAKQQAYISVKERQLEEYHELDILMTREKLSELQEGVSTMKSCMNTYAEHTANINMQISELVDGSKYAWLDNSESREEYHVYNNSVGCPIDDESSSTLEACSDNLIHEDVKEIEKSTKMCRGGISKDATVTLLRKEIESALESLKEVQAEVIRLNAEKQELSISERQSCEGMGMVKTQISHILATFGDFEDRCLYKIKVVNQKVEQVEQHAEEATRLWCQAKEIFEGELSNATADVAKKTAEASCFFSKFEEAQDIMKEADVMIRGLMIANETMKLEIKDLKRANLSLSSERDGLVQDIQDLHSYTAVNDQQCHELLQELEMVISQARCTSEEAVLSMSADIFSVKYQLFDSRQVIHLWLEDAWSEIIVKDSAFSVLHLCHKGILLEAVTGLNAENFLLSNRLCDSDAMISHLREQNIKSVQELEAFNVLKGKLLADIKRSFDCVTSKENETEELGAKLRAFESKITDLQLKDELMLERSNYLGFELANLVNDLNHSNSDTLALLLEQEKLLNDSKEATISQEESLMMELLAKDLELVIMTSELQQLADEKADMETNQIARNTVLEHLKKEFVTLSFTSNLMQQLMLERDDEVIQLQKEVGNAELHLTRSSADIIYLDVVNTALNEELVLQKEIAFLNEKLDYELHEALADKEKLSEHLHKVEIEYSNVADKLKTLEGEFQSSCGCLLALDQQKQDLDNELKMKDEQLSKMKFLEQENLSLKEKLDELKSQSSMLITDVQQKDSEVKSCQDHIHILVSEKCRLQENIHDMESKISFLQEDLDLRDAEVIQLQKEVGEAELQLTRSCADIIYLDVVNIALNEELVLQKEIAFLNEKLDYELREALADKENLSEHLHKVEIEYSNVADKLKTLEGEFQSSCGRMLALDQQKQDLDNELKMKDKQLSKMKFLEQENHSLKEKLDELKSQSSMLITDVQEKDSEVKSCQEHIHILVSEKCRLQENIHDMESKVSFLQEDLDLRKADLKELQFSHSSANEELCQKSQELQNHEMKMDTLEEENLSLKNELSLLRLCKFEDLRLTISSVTKCLNLTKAAEMESHRMCALLNDKIEIVSDRLSQDICGNLEAVAKIEEMLEPLDTIAETIISENSTLQAELLRKDDVLKGLLFDLSLLQESASSTKDQKDEIEELTASLNYKEDELKTKAHELDDVVAHVHQLEAQMKEKIDNILLLERDLSTKTNAVELFSKEKADLTSHVDEILAAKVTLERELNEKKKLVESIEIEIMDMEKSVDQANVSIESLKSELEKVSSDRDHMHEELCDLEEKLDTAQALSEEYEAIAMEAKQIAESNRIYGEEKEEEVKLLEKSVQELDRTVDVLENKVDILGEEAERQRLQREELEMELDSLKYQIHNLKSADSDVKRHLEEKGQNLQKALKHVQKLEKDLANKDTEISHCKAHITELNLHAEAQASEYKKKFKALEAMAGQVKTEGPSSHGKSSSSNKLEKNATKPRGSGSPFKCIGIGLAQQLKLEKDEEFTAERLRIQELEALVANRQKEIFVLNNRLAAAESMTHDVIRDLLGVKLDMTNYVSLLDKQQVQKIAESAQLDNVDSEVKVEEISKLKKLLSDFVEERKGWLEEIDRRQAELLTAQLALEKLHQRDRSLTAENEVLKVDVEKYKKKVVKLEGEVNKLSGQQNLHQRIHHHAKIKEENNILKRQNEELSARLQRAETLLMRMKVGLAGLRATNGKVNYIDFDEEKRLSNKLKEAEEERVQLAQELLGLCTSILKAAGVKKASSDISVASAEEALEQLRSKFTSLERELENLKLKSRIANERIRLSEIIMQSPPLRPGAEDNCTTPKRTSQSPFFSAVDR